MAEKVLRGYRRDVVAVREDRGFVGGQRGLDIVGIGGDRFREFRADEKVDRRLGPVSERDFVMAIARLCQGGGFLPL